MEAIKNQLSEMCKLACEISDISYNFKMGFISLPEMLGQIKTIEYKIECIKFEIRNEFDINDNAIHLLLQM
jgi:hypothetical protein